MAVLLQLYPQIEEPDFEWGKCPYCGFIVRSKDISSYHDLLTWIGIHSKLGGLYIEHYCEGIASRGKIVINQLKDYTGPEYEKMPDKQRECLNIVDTAKYFVVNKDVWRNRK